MYIYVLDKDYSNDMEKRYYKYSKHSTSKNAIFKSIQT